MFCSLVQLIDINKGKNFQEYFAQFGGLVPSPGPFELSSLLQLMNNQLSQDCSLSISWKGE